MAGSDNDKWKFPYCDLLSPFSHKIISKTIHKDRNETKRGPDARGRSLAIHYPAI